ncbi:long-chain-fatty-acid--CoA ligase [Actinomycetospora endophytica]|uniref:Long-chain-fatty-acid--CoA ligase n=1 Tax=Actinomycetospora endophytica TaxID=2291215 RepID=A0ABS8PIB9_9PSEU|nr:long-chain-fatty-acid--CoA ligase [Actinomycetospora endophytica]MCD2197967.1 long-chain-fatty-acid--CoA ligase [Actinomycetospora endophytica]
MTAPAAPVMDASLGDLLTRVTALGTDRPAITLDDRTVTFGELDRRANQVAHVLTTTGLVPGDRLAVLLRNTPEFQELLFGAARAGVVLVALNWRLAGPELETILTDADPRLLVAGQEHLALIPDDHDARTIVLETDYEPWLADAPDNEPPDHEATPDDVVLQLYSSGTTGAPKGARLTHANLAFTPRMGREFYAMGPDSVNLVPSPLFHIGGVGYGLTALGQGGHTILLSDLSPAHLLEQIERHRVTHAFAVPAVIGALLTAPRIGEADLTSLQRIAYGGAPMTEALLRRAIDALGCGFMAVYGMTETAGTVVTLAPDEHDPGGPRAHLLRSVGRPLPWLEVDVVDPVSEQSVGPGEVGEIRVRSGQNTPGYWNRPEETAATLTDGGWLRTGDAAYRDAEGYLYLHDRIKDLIISGGENIYPAEVENALAADPTIADVAVIGVPSPRWGETVKAVVVPAPDATIEPAAVLERVRERLARYKCPTSIDVVEALPRNAAGKVLKRELRAPYWG